WSAACPSLSLSTRMIRSARCTRWWARTSGGRKRAQPPARAAQINITIPSSEEDRQATGVLLQVAGVVGIEDGVIAEIEPQSHALLEGEQQPPTDVRAEIVAGV